MISRLPRIAAVALVALLSVGGGVLAQNAVNVADLLEADGIAPMPVEEMQALFDGNTVRHTSLGNGAAFDMYFDGSGTRFVNAGRRVIETEYWYADGQRCENSVNPTVEGAACSKVFTVEKRMVLCVSYEGYVCNWELELIGPGRQF